MRAYQHSREVQPTIPQSVRLHHFHLGCLISLVHLPVPIQSLGLAQQPHLLPLLAHILQLPLLHLLHLLTTASTTIATSVVTKL